MEPPYVVRIGGTNVAPAEVQAEIALLETCLREARAEFNTRKGYDVDVTIERVSP